ncbi:hypothetical protein NDU88_004021 [Pleurodeles waltl]|uniref:Uncharacterized protein n=1 Tax=Pleurodeles waltl TaxID=8319 RepID=A0AAV7RHH2_PLEWA|nr:hypothetical protein NDU88_004021 [Pleurodeles waltl]
MDEQDGIDAEHIKRKALEKRKKHLGTQVPSTSSNAKEQVCTSDSKDTNQAEVCVPETSPPITKDQQTSVAKAPNPTAPQSVIDPTAPPSPFQNLDINTDVDQSGCTTYLTNKRKSRSSKHVVDKPLSARKKRCTTSLDRLSQGSRFAPLHHLSDSEEVFLGIAHELEVSDSQPIDFDATPDLEGLVANIAKVSPSGSNDNLSSPD